ncbi:MAG: BBP7 family outer membrane beta-barrel protein [Pirellulales bacterium]
MFALQSSKWIAILLVGVVITVPRWTNATGPRSQLVRLPGVEDEPTAPSPSDLPGGLHSPRPELRMKPPLEDSPATDIETPQPEPDRQAVDFEPELALDFVETDIHLPRPVLLGDVQYLLMTRAPASRSLPLVVDGNSGDVLARGDQLRWGFDSALRASVGYRFCHAGTLELGYFHYFENGSHFTAFGQQFPGGNASAPGPLGAAGLGFDRFHQLAVDYTADLSGFEINWVLGCGLSPTSLESRCTDACPSEFNGGGVALGEWFVGYRQLQLDEQWRMTGSGSGVNAGQIDTYTVDARNDLYGAQLGARWRWLSHRWGLDARTTAGLFGVHAEQQSQVSDVTGAPLRRDGIGSSDGLAVVVEAGLGAVYRIDHRWTLRAGYQLMWIQGIALAASQVDYGVDFRAGRGIDRDDGLLLHGFQVGLEACW